MSMNHIAHEGIYHDEMVAALIKPGQVILDQLTPEKVNLWHMASALHGEAGELFDAVKKHIVYNEELNRINVIEECADLEFFMEGLRTALGITREETLVANIAKLSKRYKKLKYSDEAAKLRADKTELTEPQPA